jgi:hypothetical protein
MLLLALISKGKQVGLWLTADLPLPAGRQEPHLASPLLFMDKYSYCTFPPRSVQSLPESWNG